MDSGVLNFWDNLRGKVAESIEERTRNCIRRGRFEVVTAPDGQTMGVKQPYGNTVYLPYSPNMAGAQPGDAVYAQWSKSLSSGFIYAYGDGMSRSTVLSPVTVGTAWTETGGIYVQTVAVQGMKSTYYPTAGVLLDGTNGAAKIEAWNKIQRIETLENALKVYTAEQTTTPIEIILKLD